MPVARLNQALRGVPGWAIYPLALLPLIALIWQAAANDLGPDPAKVIERRLGEVGLQLILAGLAVTPLRRIAGLNLIRYRRAIGLMAFFYIGLHLATWLILDLQLRWAEIAADLVKRPFVILGMVGFLLLIPLAITSNNRSIRWLGATRWQRLHRLVYLAAAAGGLHYLLLTKVWTLESLLYAAGIGILLALRLGPLTRKAPVGMP